jgi:CubicO group peptidase (beta-lactamase class C family)
MGQIIREEIMLVLKNEFYFGIPQSEEHRISNLVGVPILRAAQHAFNSLTKTESKSKSKKIRFNRLQLKAILSQPKQIMPWPHSHNRKQIWRSESPSFAGITNSGSLAKFAALMANNGTLDSVTMISAKTLEKSHEPLPWMPDQVVKRNVTYSKGGWGLNMTFPGCRQYKFTGWGGVGGSMVFWNREMGISFSYVMNSLSYSGIGDKRSWVLICEFVRLFEQQAELSRIEKEL